MIYDGAVSNFQRLMGPLKAFYYHSIYQSPSCSSQSLTSLLILTNLDLYKYTLKFEQIPFKIWTNNFENLEKYIFKFGQTMLKYLLVTILFFSVSHKSINPH